MLQHTLPMSDAEVGPLFHRCFYEHGGVSLTSTPDVSFYRERYLEYMRQYRSGDDYARAFASTYFHMIRNKAVGAASGRLEGVDYVGLYDGSVINITTLFRILLSHRLSFTDIGDAQAEKPWWLTMDGIDWTLPLRESLSGILAFDVPPDEFPCDAARSEFASDLATFALDFLTFHELGHVAHGHLDYVEEHYGQRVLTEGSVVEGMTPDLTKLLELGADQFAIEQTGWNWLPDNSTIMTKFSSRAEALRRWTLAIGILFMVFDNSRATLADYADSGHPHPSLRLVAAYGSMLDHARRCGQKAIDDLDTAWERALSDMDVISECFKLGSALFAQVETDSQDVFAENDRLLKIWNDDYKSSFKPYYRLGSIPKSAN